MAKLVFILGAGASRHAGAPLMFEFLERAWDRLGLGGDGQGREDLRLVRAGVNELQLAHSKGDLDIWNVEAVFDAFEMGALCGQLGGLPQDEVGRLPGAMRRVIVDTLENTVELPVGQYDGRITAGPSDGYWRFAKALKGAFGRPDQERPAIITFNYDVCLDFALAFEGWSVDYCLTPPGPVDAMKLLRLHGSIGWARCECGETAALRAAEDLLDFGDRAGGRARVVGAELCRLAVAEKASTRLKCRCGPEKRSTLVVPPTMNKGQHYEALSSVWSAAAKELGAAERIIVCGYSFPPTDQFFRYLYGIGTIGEASLRQFWVFDRYPGDTLEPRFRGLLGKQVLGQPDRFRVWSCSFESVPWDDVLRRDVHSAARQLERAYKL